MRKITTALLFAVVAYFSFVGVALAQGAVVPADGSILDIAKPVYEAVMGGQWWLAAALGLILLTTAAKRYLPGKAGRWVNGDVGQPLTVLLLAFGGAAATALLAAGPGAVVSGGLVWAALKIGIGAAGGYAMFKPILVPLLTKLADKMPASVKPIFAVLLWAFSKPTPVQVAETAGDAAVAAKPPTGAPASDVTEI